MDMARLKDDIQCKNVREWTSKENSRNFIPENKINCK
jgi:hypothetical protein